MQKNPGTTFDEIQKEPGVENPPFETMRERAHQLKKHQATVGCSIKLRANQEGKRTTVFRKSSKYEKKDLARKRSRGGEIQSRFERARLKKKKK